MSPRSRMLPLVLVVLGWVDLTDAAAQTQGDANFLFYRKQLSRFPVADSVSMDTVFEFAGYVQLSGTRAHFETFFEDNSNTNHLVEPWLGPRVQNISYKVAGNNITLKAGQSMNGLIVTGDSVNWSQLNRDAVHFLLIPFGMPDKFKPFNGAWSLTTSTGYQLIIDIDSKVHEYQPYWSVQYGATEWPRDKQVLPIGLATLRIENGAKIISTLLELLSLHWVDKEKHYRVEGFENKINKKTKRYRFSGTFEKLALPPKQSLEELEERLLGDWVSVGTWGIVHPSGDTVALNDAWTIHVDDKRIRVTWSGDKAGSFDDPWNLSKSGRLLKMGEGGDLHSYVEWPFWFVGDTLVIRLSLSMREAPYYLKEVRFRKK